MVVSEVSQAEKDEYQMDITCVWNLKYDTIYETETDSLLERTDLWLQGRGRGWTGRLGSADANHYIQYGQTTRSCCMAQGLYQISANKP